VVVDNPSAWYRWLITQVVGFNLITEVVVVKSHTDVMPIHYLNPSGRLITVIPKWLIDNRDTQVFGIICDNPVAIYSLQRIRSDERLRSGCKAICSFQGLAIYVQVAMPHVPLGDGNCNDNDNKELRTCRLVIWCYG
jgi:hypothetical protein